MEFGHYPESNGERGGTLTNGVESGLEKLYFR